MKLLIADDEKTIRDGLASLPWQSIGINKIHEATNGLSAKEILKTTPIDVVISDVKMPGMTGLELAEYVREYNLDMAVILLTGFSDFSFAQSAIKSGVMDYMLKPVSPEGIINTVSTVVERLKQKRYEAKVVRQYERDANSVDLGEQLHHQFRGVSEQPIKILQYMAKNFTNEISQGEIAEKYHFSAAHLSRMMKKETGYAFSEILISMRLFEATLLLKEDKIKVSLIGEKIGFKDSRYFSQVFKKVFICTPNEYRKNAETQKTYNIKEILEIMREKK